MGESLAITVIMVDQRCGIVPVSVHTGYVVGYAGPELPGDIVDIFVLYVFRAEHPELRTRFARSWKPGLQALLCFLCKARKRRRSGVAKRGDTCER